MQICQIFLPLKELLVATLNETCRFKSRIFVAKEGMMTIPNLSETLRFLWPKPKKEECDQRDLNISDEFETLITSSTIYFLGMRARPLQRLSTRNSFIGKKNFMVYNFWGLNSRIKIQECNQRN